MGLLGSLIGGGLSIIGNLIGGHQSSKAVQHASDAEIAAMNRGIDEQRRQFDLTRQDYAPWQQSGAAAIGDIGDLLGLNGPDKQAAALQIIQNSPILSGLISNGEEGILQNASATGGLRGGNVQRSLADFRSNAFNQVLTDQLSRLGGVAGAGAGMATNLGGLGADMANNVSKGLTNIGQAQAGNFLGQAGINNSMINNITGALGSVLNQIKGF